MDGGLMKLMGYIMGRENGNAPTQYVWYFFSKIYHIASIEL